MPAIKRKEKLYGNICVLNRKGQEIFHCNIKKSNWYLKRNLAVQLSPNKIQLNFETKGNGHLGDSFFLNNKKNVCVVCGKDFELSKHHVAPFCYRKYFPKEHKNHNCYDVMLLCLNCHSEYENYAQKLKKELAEKYQCPLQGKGMDYDKEKSRIRNLARALFFHKNQIPLPRIMELEKEINDYCVKNNVENNLEHLFGLKFYTKSKNFISHGEYVVSQINIEEFILMWRRHFLSLMKPKFIPEFWDIERIVKKIP